MKKGQEYTGKIIRTDFPNKGIIEHTDDDGKKNRVFVKDGIEGQTVKFTISKLRSSKSEGNIREVLARSPLENRMAPCPHFGECGGCTYQRLTYGNQLMLKSGQVKRLLDAAVPYEYDFLSIAGSPNEFAYRNKMEFSFGDEMKDGPLTLGLHKRGSFYDVITTDQCMIVNDDYTTILKMTLELANRFGLDYFHKISHKGYLRHLLIRRAATTGEILVCLVTSSQYTENAKGTEEDFLSAFKDNLRELTLHGSFVGILHCINDSLSDSVRADKMVTLYGKDFYFEQLLELIFRISVFSFFQTNSFGAEVLYKTVRDFVGNTKDKVIFDLYSGTGTITQILAPVAKKVIGVEIVEEAVEAAKENASLNGLSQCEFLAGDVLKVIDEIEDKPDIIVLDPPREGVMPKALAKILKYGVERIIYISCKPTSLARDLAAFHEAGYKLVKAKCVDMFAQTANVETVALLSKKNEKNFVEIGVDAEDYYRIKDQ